MEIKKRIIIKRRLRSYGLHDVNNLDDKMLLKLEALLQGIIHFTNKSSYFVNGLSIPNNGNLFCRNYAENILRGLK